MSQLKIGFYKAGEIKMSNKLDELKTTHDVVLEVLESQPLARNSDNVLSYWVYSVIGKRKGIDIDSMSIPRFFLHMKEFGFPSTETIRRTRQKIQAERPELCAVNEVDYMRKVNEEAFVEYARG